MKQTFRLVALAHLLLAWTGLVDTDASVTFYGGTGYGGPNPFDLVEINPSTGATTGLLNGTYWNGLDFTPDGATLYAASDTLCIIDLDAGTYTEVAELTYEGSEPIGVLSMTIAPDGQMYVLSNKLDDPAEEKRFYRVNTQTGELTYLGTPQGFVWAIEFAPDGTLYAAQFDLMVLNPADGSLVQTIGSFGSFQNVVELDFAGDGNLYATHYEDGLFQINISTAEATLLTTYSSGDPVWSLASRVSSDPEVTAIWGMPPTIEWPSKSGATYEVWVSGGLSTWTSAGISFAASGTGSTTWTDNGLHPLGPATEAQQRYYRVERLQGP